MTNKLKWMTLASVIALSGCVMPAEMARPGEPGPRTEPMSADQLGQTDFNRTVSVAMRDNLDSLYVLAEKLYRRNPREWQRSGATGPEDAVLRIRVSVEAMTAPPGLQNLKDIQILGVALDPNYHGDRVAAYIYGLADTLVAAHNGKTRMYATDILNGQRVFNAARNVEIAAWMLQTRRDNHGVLLLLANEWSNDTVNLSFERTFGAIIGRLDLIANLLGENSRRIGINYAQGFMLFNFLPVR